MDDSKQKSSIDIVSLNNMVVNLRPITKKTKIQVTQRLNKTIKLLQEKISKPDDNRSKRAAKLLEEIRILKISSIDDITKFCLTQSGAIQNDAKNKEQAVLARIAKHKLMSEKIQALKKEHEDWDSLVFFIKNHVPRRVKKKAAKKRNKLESKNKPIEPVAKAKNKDEPILMSAPVPKVEESHVVITTDETMEQLRIFGGMVQAFDAGEDCSLEHLPIDASADVGEDSPKKTDKKASKKKFFEGCDDDDDDGGDNNNQNTDTDTENNVSNNRQYLFKKKSYNSDLRKPFVKSTNYKQNHVNVIKSVSETKERKYSKKPMENLHPSWEAKRKEKEMMKNNMPKSTKIVFDD